MAQTDPKASTPGPGFRLSRVQEGSLYHRVGLKAGDLVQAIDGCLIRTPESVLNVYPEIKKAGPHIVDLVRGGVAWVLTWHGDGISPELTEARLAPRERPPCTIR